MSSVLPFRRRAVLRLAFAALLITGVPAAPASAQTALAPDAVQGVRTKWEYTAGENRRYSLLPDLAGLALGDWMRTLEALEVNVADLNLDPRAQIGKAPAAPEELASYLGALRVPAPMRSEAESARIARWRRDIAEERYTPEERDAVLLDFLARLDLLKRAGEIEGSVRFILHQRQWLRPGGNARRRALRAERVGNFATDMAGFINKARAEGLDDWIAGVRLGEHANPEMDELLPALLEIAREVNRQTDGWLRGRLFLANGGGMGARYAGLTDPAASYAEFLAGISDETGAFAFGYKWMLREGDERHIAAIMDAAACEPEGDCDRRSVDDWTVFLRDMLGFDELVAAVAAQHDRYPAHANVVFVGDSSDALTLMVRRRKEGALADAPQLVALRDLWPRTEGWRGKLFMNGFLTADTTPRLRGGATADIGMGLHFGDGAGGLRRLPRSLALFRAWPAPPGG